MYCQSCGTQLPPQAKACPNCGTLTAASYTDSSASPHEPTYVSAPSSSFDPLIAPPPPSTEYGSPPYDMPLQRAYDGPPYNVPPPLPPRRKVSPLILGLLTILILLIIGASVGFVFLRNNQATTAVAPSSGEIGLVAGSIGAPSEVVYNNLKIWTLL